MDQLCSLPNSGGSVGVLLLAGALAIVAGIAVLAIQRRVAGGRAAPLVLLAAIAIAAFSVVFAAQPAAAIGDNGARLAPRRRQSPGTCIPPPPVTSASSRRRRPRRARRAHRRRPPSRRPPRRPSSTRLTRRESRSTRPRRARPRRRRLPRRHRRRRRRPRRRPRRQRCPSRLVAMTAASDVGSRTSTDPLTSKLRGFGTTIFAEMSALAVATGFDQPRTGLSRQRRPAGGPRCRHRGHSVRPQPVSTGTWHARASAGDRPPSTALLRPRTRSGRRGARHRRCHRGARRRVARDARRRRRSDRVRADVRQLPGVHRPRRCPRLCPSCCSRTGLATGSTRTSCAPPSRRGHG